MEKAAQVHHDIAALIPTGMISKLDQLIHNPAQVVANIELAKPGAITRVLDPAQRQQQPPGHDNGQSSRYPNKEPDRAYRAQGPHCCCRVHLSLPPPVVLLGLRPGGPDQDDDGQYDNEECSGTHVCLLKSTSPRSVNSEG
jgi:hypothetical protein